MAKNRIYETMQRQTNKISSDAQDNVTKQEFEKLVTETPTDLAFDNTDNLVLKHDSKIISKQTPLSLGAMKGPIITIEISAPAESTEGSNKHLLTVNFMIGLI